MDRRPLSAWEPPDLQATSNSLYESKGEITFTIPLEYAAVILGMLGASPSTKHLKDGTQCRMSALYSGLEGALVPFGFGFGNPYRAYGRDIVKEGQQLPEYMRPK